MAVLLKVWLIKRKLVLVRSLHIDLRTFLQLKMTSSRSSQLPTNLKERIAALEQRNAENIASIQRATSPTPSVASNSSHSGSSNGALRDRIARFEKKGGVPVPKGRFGLGAPPSIEGPRKRGELYGNRIPVPSRTLSGGKFPLSRPLSTTYDERRSFSASSVATDFGDDHFDLSPISSPSLSLPPDSPDSTTSMSDVSPSSADFSAPKQNLARATSFAQALEVARKAEMEKREPHTFTNPTSRMPPSSEGDSHVETPAPIIVVSSEDVYPVVMPETPILNATSVPSTPRDSPPLEKVQPNDKPPETETVIANGTSPVIPVKEAPRVGTPPLNIRKRSPTESSIPPVEDEASKAPDTNAVFIEPQVPVSPVPQAIEWHDVPAWISDAHNKEPVDSLPVQPELVEVDEPVPSEQQLSAPEVLPICPQLDIVILDEQPEENNQEPDDAENDPFINSNTEVRSRKLGLTLDSRKLEDGTLVSPPPQSGHALVQATTSHPSSGPLATDAITSPDSFLSPLNLHFGSPSSTDSLLSSLGSRPMSMIESSPKVVTQIVRMTPAVSRGVPVFLPGPAPPRKSDFVYFPPTPENEDTDLSSLASHSNKMRSESDPEDIHNMPSGTFSAVVHGKVRETPASVTPERTLPQTPQARRTQRATILETPFSPGHRELAALLHEAVLLEDTLNKGELPFEKTQFEEETQQKEEKVKEAAAAEAQSKAKAGEEERSRLALATAQLQNKRDEPTSGRLKHTFLVPLSKARSRHRKEIYTAKAESFFSRSEEPSVLPESAGLPSTNSLAMGSATLQNMSAKQPAVNGVNSTTTRQPTKSAKFSSLRKFSSSVRTIRSTSSEISSEESFIPDEFGCGTGSTLSFPSISPKKASRTLARATSFAEKLFSRGRTKSGGSTLSSTSEVNDVNSPVKTPAPRIPAVALSTTLEFPTLPGHSDVPPPSFDKPDIPLRRSTSSKRLALYFPRAPDLAAVPQLPSIISGLEITSLASSTLLLPDSIDSPHSPSTNSVSSAGFLPSPLFNQELVDAFPSVPATAPTTISFLNREIAPATPSFDTALLSSAIHLASTSKMATPKASSKPLPVERAATLTPASHT